MGRYNCTGASSRRAEFVHVAHHADDLQEMLAIERDPLADGVFILPGAPRHRLVHQARPAAIPRCRNRERRGPAIKGIPTVRK